MSKTSTEENVCRFCGTLKDDSKKFYRTISKEPWCNNIYFCNNCKKVLEKARWFDDKHVEEIK